METVQNLDITSHVHTMKPQTWVSNFKKFSPHFPAISSSQMLQFHNQ
uniref:Uncharacterized protein n=1 Tax=Anguilla anguilla TaxID=7936 RepID=A0A0E9WG63_ANGAN